MNGTLTPTEKLTCAYMHYVEGIEQQQLAMIYRVNMGRVNEACQAVNSVLKISERKKNDVVGRLHEAKLRNQGSKCAQTATEGN